MSKFLCPFIFITFFFISIFGLTAQAQESCTGDVCTINTAQTSSSPWASDAEKHMKEWEALSKQSTKSSEQFQYDLYPTEKSEKKVPTTDKKKETKQTPEKSPTKTRAEKTEATTGLQNYEFQAGKNVLYVTLKDGKIVDKGYAIWDAKDPSANKIKDLMIQGISFEKIEQTLGPGRLMK